MKLLNSPLGWLIVVLFATGVVQAAWYYPQLPQEIAVHFGGNGAPNRWGSTAGYFAISLGIMLMLGVLAFWAPMSKALENPGHRLFRPRIPYRDYWLADDRRAQTIAWLETGYRWMFALSLVLVLLVNELVMRANLATPVVLDSGTIWLLLLFYFALVVVWLVMFLRRFKKPA